jgi:hypothetical protein
MAASRQVASQRSGPRLVAHEAHGTHQASMADELASTVEHLLSTRYAAARLAEEIPTRRVVQAITGESLLAELAAARQSGGGQPASRSADPETPQRSGSFLTRAFAFAGVAVILLTLVCMSPLRDYVPSPLRDQVDRITHFALASLGVR